jgi:hypothetical protein
MFLMYLRPPRQRRPPPEDSGASNQRLRRSLDQAQYLNPTESQARLAQHQQIHQRRELMSTYHLERRIFL